MKYARVWCASNEPVHKHRSRNEKEKRTKEGHSPHLLPLEEGSEGNPLICTILFLFNINTIMKRTNEFIISSRR